VQLNQNKSLYKRASFAHEYPPTKLMFIPDEVVLTDSGWRQARPIGNFWGVPEDLAHRRQQPGNSGSKSQKRRCEVRQDNDFSAPLTSFDWNPEFSHLIGTSSIDTTCTIWDIEKGAVFTQLIAHDKEVYDIHFSR